MKKICILLLLVAPFVLQFCSSSKKGTATPKVAIVSYTGNVKPLMQANCTPCHFPPNGREKSFDNYTAAKNNIDAIVNRVNRNPMDKGFMPKKHPKLSDSSINVLVQWKKDGLVEN